MAVETNKFQAESKELLNLMINSIYSNKEIFLRELISNASDAIDKRRFESLNSNGKIPLVENPEIEIIPNKVEHTLTIKDDGIGMSHDELISNIGTIAKSGSKEFISKLKEAENNKDLDIIGQFGVGFYSAFMVAKKIVIETKGLNEKSGYRFESEGSDTYTIEEISKEEVGTSITLYLKDDKDEEKYSTYLDYPTIEYLVEKYSNYIKYPIKMCEHIKEPKKDKDGKYLENEYDEKDEVKTLNSMVPLWKKPKKDVKDEDLNSFYKNNFHDYLNPLHSIQINVEGLLSYQSLIFIPSHLRNEVYNRDEAGLSLYAKNVFIVDKCKELLPHYLFFLEGIVDSNDLSLNISREMLQQDRNITRIRDNIENKVVANLKDLKEKDKEKYAKIFDLFGSSLKYGIYENYGMKNDLLKDLLVYKSLNHDNEYIDLKTYVSEMKENQKAIYFASGSSIEEIKLSPELEKFKKDGIDVLFFDKDVDEFAINTLREYETHLFKSISTLGEEDLNEEEKKKLEELNINFKRQLDDIKEALKDKVSDVKFSTKLVNSPVSLSSKEGITLNMEKILNNLNRENNGFKSEKVLEINPDHDLFKAIKELKARGMNVTATAVYDLMQAYMALEAGADYIAPYVNRIGNLGSDPFELIHELSSRIEVDGYDCKILAASFKGVQQVRDAFNSGSHAITAPVAVLNQIFKNPNIEKAVADFNNDWYAMYGEGKGICDL